MNTSSTHIHVNPNSPKDAFPNVINFRFSHLKKYKSYKQVKGEPKKCVGCGAVLLNNWTCRFCHTENDTNCELPESNDVEFILEQKKYSDENARYIVFCLDTSGSMGEPVIIDKFIKLPTDEVSERRFQKLAEEMRNAIGEDISFEDQYRVGGNLPDGKRLVTRLDMIQTGVIKNLENIQKDNGDKKVAIVTFNNEVCIVGDGLIDKVILNNEAMNSKRSIESCCRTINRIEHIGHNPGLLIKKVLEFENKGQTALGPALYASVLLASRRSGSTVLLFTDGLANIGLGNLYDENQFEASREFYQDIAEIASSRGVTVSIATLEGVDSGLELIGQVAQKSGGDIFSVDPTNLNNIVLEFNETTTVGTTIATNMTLSIYVPKEFIIKDYREGITNTNMITKEIGNIKKNTEIGFEIVGTKDCRNLIGLQIPIQIQLSYKSDDGSKVLRVISVFKEISNNQKLVEKNSDRCVLGSYVIRTKANLKNHSNELVLLAKRINEAKVEKEDNFDKEKFQLEILKVGIKLPGLEAPAFLNSMNTNNSVDFFVSSMNRASQMTSESLKKK